MAWDPNRLRTAMSTLGFVEDPPTIMSLGISFTGPIVGNWVLSAYASQSSGVVEDISFGIFPNGERMRMCRGTQHRISNEAALGKHGQHVVTELKSLAANESTLRCPKCAVRWVHLNKPTAASYKQFAPFLSCDGMTKTSSRSNVQCDGTSRVIPALRTYA